MGLTGGLVIAAAASLSLNASYVVQHSALSATAPVTLRQPLISLRGLLGSRRWVAGAALSYGGLALNVAAMSLAPLWLVQAMIAAGLVLVSVAWARMSGRALTRQEQAAVALLGVGLLVLALTGQGGRPGIHPTPITLAGFLVVSAALAGAAVRSRQQPRLGLASGMLYGGTTVALAAIPGALTAGAVGILAVAVLVGGAITAAGFFAFQRALQTGGAAAVVTQMTAGMNAVAIAGGLGLGSGLATSWLARSVQLGGLTALCAAAVLGAGGLTRRR